MSCDFDSVLANSVGQDPTAKRFSGCLFSTLSGVRPCEPSTVATLAMHHTLSHLLCCCTQNVLFSGEVPARVNRADNCRTKSNTESAPACEFSLSDVQDLQRLISTVASTSVEMCGVLFNDTPIISQLRKALLRCGDNLASHLMEGYVGIMIGAVYIYLTVTFGIPLFSGLWSHAVASRTGFDDESLTHFLIGFLVSHIDAHLYVFLGAIIVTLHRWLYGRRLWTRYCARTVVIVDSTVNYKLLRAYLSKLRALAFRFTTFGVAGQNGQDHFVHEMTHLTTSEVILAVGRPDGRLATMATPEAACLMSVQQARFIAARSCSGVEAFSVSHNPWVKPGVFTEAVTIPTTFRPEFLSCRLLRTGEGPHAPGDVVSKIAALTEEEHNQGGSKRLDQDFPFVEVEELLRRMKCKTIQGHVSKTRAEEIIKDIVEEQADDLGIAASMFDVEPIISSAMQRTRTSVETSIPMSTDQSPKKGLSNSRLTNFAFIVPTSSEKKRTKSTASTVTASGEGMLTASQIMSMLRGAKMQEQLLTLRKKLRSQDLMREAVQDFFTGSSEKVLTTWFQAWIEYVRNEMSRKKKLTSKIGRKLARQKTRLSAFDDGSIDPSQDDMGQCAEWRIQEEIRRFARKRTAFLMGQYRDVCFELWKVATREGKEQNLRRQLTRTSTTMSLSDGPSASGASGRRISTTSASGASGHRGRKQEPEPPISKDLIGKLEGKDLFAELSVLETLYETRVAAAERLLAFFVIFHKAVRPISRLPWLRFDMDRSESRLRVASTPAPVPFVEEIATHSPVEKAAQRLQRIVRQRRRAMEEATTEVEEIEVAECVTPRSHHPPSFSIFSSRHVIDVKSADESTPLKSDLLVDDFDDQIDMMLQEYPNVPTLDE